jgi:hypothetical protein
MSSPCEEITATCPKCHKFFETWHRPSLNLRLDDFDDEYIRSVNVKTCPHCNAEVQVSSLIVGEDGVWRFVEGNAKEVTLEGVMRQVLAEQPDQSATVQYLAGEIVRRCLYRFGSDPVLPELEVHYRARQHPELFRIEGVEHVRLVRPAPARPPYSPAMDDAVLPIPCTKEKFDLMWLRPNPAIAGYDRNLRYALTIDGYAYYSEVWHTSDDALREKVMSYRRRNGHWYGSFQDLRACLFFFQRSIRAAEGSWYDKNGRRMYDAIYRAVCAAWERESAEHAEEVALAYQTLDRLRREKGSA